jgi:hypothetical protein
MTAFLTLVRYKKRHIYFALCAMALHRIPLWRNPLISFHKTLGCGKGDTFSQNADWQQYGLLAVTDEDFSNTDLKAFSAEEIQKKVYGSFVTKWWRFFGCESYTIMLQPIEGHGLWDGKTAFGELPPKSDYSGPLGVLTRATIHQRKSKRFWEHVEAVSEQMRQSPGYLFSIGVGETPWLRQATFSVWNSKEEMKSFAYRSVHHADVIVKTRKEQWYKEDMFVRFRILSRWGTLRGRDPLNMLFARKD